MLSIRGKRKRQYSTTATPSSPRNQSRLRHGRPMERAAYLSTARGKLVAQVKELRKRVRASAMKSQGSLCSLEKLPLELLQQIFFHCFEVNLPKASPYLARALSTDITYKVLILFAFFDDDDQYPVEQQHFLPAAYRRLTIRDRINLQSQILTCRWCTLERIKACLPVLSRLQMVQAWYRERHEENETLDLLGIHHDFSLIVPDESLADIASCPGLQDQDKMVKHFCAAALLPITLASASNTTITTVTADAYLPRIVTWTSKTSSVESEECKSLYKTRDSHRSVIAARVLPAWLLTSCSQRLDYLEFLQLLRQGLRFIQRDFVLEISASAVFEGMANAIRAENVTALRTLLELHNDVFEKKDPMDESSLAPGTHHKLPIDLFHLATKAGAQSSNVMWLLIRGGVQSVPDNDDILLGWALHRKAEGDKVASWLLDHMSVTNDYQFGERGYLFFGGQLTWRVSSDLFPPARLRFAQELGYLEGTKRTALTNMNGEPCG